MVKRFVSSHADLPARAAIRVAFLLCLVSSLSVQPIAAPAATGIGAHASALDVATCIEDFAIGNTPGQTFLAGESFVEATTGTPMTFLPFLPVAGGQISGTATVTNTNLAAATSPELALFELSLGLQFSPSVGLVSVYFHEIGPAVTDVNLGANADVVRSNNFFDPQIAGATIGAASVSVTGSPAPTQTGVITLSGLINTLRIGGGNLRIDRICFERVGTPGQLSLSKTTVIAGGGLQPGDVFTYSIQLNRAGGSGPIPVRITDTLPGAVNFVGPVSIAISGLPAVTQTAVVVHGTVHWRGLMPPNSQLLMRIPVRAAACIGSPRVVNNTANAIAAGQALSASTDATLNCWPRFPIDVEKRAVPERALDGDETGVDAEVPNDSGVVYEFIAYNTTSRTLPLRVTDRLPDGLQRDAGQLGDFAFGSVGNEAIASILIEGGATRTLRLPTRVRVNTGVCEREIVNTADVDTSVARISTGDDGGLLRDTDNPAGTVTAQTNPSRLRVRCADLGDAPDSLNHAGMAMNAYAGIPANFPTTYLTPTTSITNGHGPRHAHALSFHLGAQVSREGEADIGPDEDGVRNLRPALNVANLDAFDDGLRPGMLAWEPCQRVNMSVRVFIAPEAILALNMLQSPGYVNAWLDGNRDGDWADLSMCESTAGQMDPAYEHIVIDQPVNAAGLGAGLHTLAFSTTGRVPWIAANPNAWLRVTLSDLPSVKNIASPAPHGDGRGPNQGFASGETEDYLWRSTAQRQPDVQVQKRGTHKLNEDGVPIIAWTIRYQNIGDADATNVIVVDDLGQAGSTSVFNITADPPRANVEAGNTITFEIGSLAPGEGGSIAIETGLGNASHLTNTVRVSSSTDSDAANDLASASVRNLPLSPPLLVTPGDGTTCDGNVLVTGRSLPGSSVQIFLDGLGAALATADGTGRFSATLSSMSNGAHAIYAVASSDGATSEPSDTRVVIVNSALLWSPLSLRLSDSQGRTMTPRDSAGRTDESGWQLSLLANEQYTISVRLCCNVSPVSASLQISDMLVILTDPDGDTTFTGAFVNSLPRRASASAVLNVQCGDDVATGGGPVLIDPDGVVYDVRDGSLLAGGEVVCLQQTGSGAVASFGIWPASLYENQVNPQTTGSNSYFSFFTPAGTYRLQSTRPGFQNYLSPDLQVINTPVHFDIPMTPVHGSPRFTITIGANGYSPAHLRVPRGSVVAFVNYDDRPHGATRSNGSSSPSQFTFDSGLLQPADRYTFQFSERGTFAYADRNSSQTGVIEVVDFVFMPLLTR